MVDNGSAREIKFDGDQLTFRFVKGGSVAQEKVLKIGADFVVSIYFKSEYPSEAEVERALNYVEYELTSDKELKCDGEILCSSNALVKEIFTEFGKTELSKEEVESVFNKYADVATGEPAHLVGIEYSNEKFAKILVIRVLVYYLGFPGIKLC